MTMDSFLQRVKVIFLAIGLFLQVQNPVIAQEGEGGQSDDILSDSINDVYLVVGAGFGGAVLGLSTLSFVDEPSENLKNVVVGGALGLILGVGIVAWSHANKSKDYYEDESYGFMPLGPKYWSPGQWHQENVSDIMSSFGPINQTKIAYSFNF